MGDRLPKYQEDVLVAIHKGINTIEEITKETGLSGTKVDIALTKLKEIGFIGNTNENR